MPLSDTAIRNAKPRSKPFKLADGGGMYLEVAPSGGKWWRLKFRFGGKEKRLSLGVYPDVGLKDARERRDEARRLLANGIDPSVARKAQKAAGLERSANSFEVVAREWFAQLSPHWAPSHSSKILRRLELDVFPWIGGRPVAEITASEVRQVLHRIVERGAVETAHRARSDCSQVFRYAIAHERAARDPAADLRGKFALPPRVRSKHYPSITDPKAIGALLRAVDGYAGAFETKCALQLAALTFVRPGELRAAEWSEFDLEGAEWRIPAARMKMREQHLVPLSKQALEVLAELRPLTGRGKYLFPSERTSSRPMSENTVNAALRRMGYGKDEMTGHGFRSMASTRLNEEGWHRDAIERQLAHGERDKIRGAYNYAEHLPERRKMMQNWADYLDRLRDGAEVIPFPTRSNQG